ncbi:Cell surface protein [Methanosarcina lacustris Z-7289]|uniref:Cell surface protein n=1 Tax=Methanosarcina lacustris Z-7289 TaxID=1434111 RepID=A0A0E3WSD5_9EURY|nr:PGF-pre-PGF domain-containing protein [Methanosarcina lacustris]AKB74240.1 Cell surface protein [Methanosarcina lacustris Z-7289]
MSDKHEKTKGLVFMKTIETLKVKNRLKISNFISGFILILFFAVTILPVSASGIEASREISAGTVYAGGTFTVTVHIQTDQYIEAPTLDENLPAGWDVTTIENAGATFQNSETFKKSTLEWIWVESLQAGGGKTVVYRVTVPSASEPGNFTISGNVSAYSVSAVPITGYITVTEKTSSSGGSSGGGGGGSPESSRNVELKEISNEQVFKGIHTCYTFKGETNEIVAVEFDPKKNFGRITTIVEMLKNTSSIVKEPAPGTVYRNLNIWIGPSGFSSPENLENARISFRVHRAWLSENGIDENTMTLYRHNENMWNALPTALTGEDEDFFYFTAETPGFSPFAIASPEKNTQAIEITQVGNEDITVMSTGEISGEESDEDLAQDNEKEGKDAPGAGVSFATAGILASYAALKKRNVK